jgi:methylglutaconyl-CoA hydratase
MPFKYLTVRREEQIEWLTLDRPEVRNAFNAAMIAELTDWAASVTAAAGELRAVVLAGAGKAFCAGGDAAWMAQTVSYSEADNLRDAAALSAMFRAIDELPVPVIGRMHGAIMGGGAGLAAVCDIVVAADDAMFGFTEVKLGLIPAVIAPFAIAKIGCSAARELFLTGARFSASRAREMGLVHAVVPMAEVDAVIARYVAELKSGGPQAIAAAKQLIRAIAEAAPEQTPPLTAAAIAARRTSAEGQEGLTAFLQKRPPRWSR